MSGNGVPVSTTPYASLSSMITEVGSNGGSWYPGQDRFTVTAHQTVGGVSDLFLSPGQMVMQIELPSDLFVKGATYTWQLQGCLADTACAGVNSVVKSDLLATSALDSIPTCPSMSGIIVHTGVINPALHSNPFSISIPSPMTDGSRGSLCAINVGTFGFVVEPPSAITSSNTAAATTPISVSGSTTEPTTGSTNSNSGSELVITLESTTLTTKVSHMTTLANGVVISFRDPSSTAVSSSSSGASMGLEGKRKSNIAVIAGCISAGVIIIIIAALFIWWTRRRKNQNLWQMERKTKSSKLNDGHSTERGTAESLSATQSPYQLSTSLPFTIASPSSAQVNQDLNYLGTPQNGGNAAIMFSPREHQDVQTPHSPPMYTSVLGDTPPSYRPALTPYTPMNRQLANDRAGYSPSSSNSNSNTHSSPGSSSNSNSQSGSSSRTRSHTRHRSRDRDRGRPSPAPNDALAIWARDNRRLIPWDLERRLRNAGYSSEYNPDGMTEEVWLDRYDVNPFELQKLRRLYMQRNADGNTGGDNAMDVVQEE